MEPARTAWVLLACLLVLGVTPVRASEAAAAGAKSAILGSHLQFFATSLPGTVFNILPGGGNSLILGPQSTFLGNDASGLEIQIVDWSTPLCGSKATRGCADWDGTKIYIRGTEIAQAQHGNLAHIIIHEFIHWVLINNWPTFANPTTWAYCAPGCTAEDCGGDAHPSQIAKPECRPCAVCVEMHADCGAAALMAAMLAGCGPFEPAGEPVEPIAKKPKQGLEGGLMAAKEACAQWMMGATAMACSDCPASPQPPAPPPLDENCTLGPECGEVIQMWLDALGGGE